MKNTIQPELQFAKRFSQERKVTLIKQGKAYVAKCDGGFFFYVNYPNDKQRVIKISKAVYEELSYVEYDKNWETAFERSIGLIKEG